MNSNSKKSFVGPPGIEIVGRVLSLNADDVQEKYCLIWRALETFQTSAWHKAVGHLCPRNQGQGQA